MSHPQNKTSRSLDVTALRSYLPALRMAERAVEAQGRELAEKFEPTSLEVWQEVHEDLQELRNVIDQ